MLVPEVVEKLDMVVVAGKMLQRVADYEVRFG
jgi:hypothetical protein